MVQDPNTPNPPNSHGHKLSKDQKVQVCQWLAEYYRTGEIIELIKKNFGIEISKQAVNKYRVNEPWRALMLEARKQWTDDIGEIPISNKKYRLKELQKISEMAQESYLKSINEHGETYDKKLKEAISAIKEANYQLEGHRILIKDEDPLKDIPIEDLEKECLKMMELGRERDAKRISNTSIADIDDSNTSISE